MRGESVKWRGSKRVIIYLRLHFEMKMESEVICCCMCVVVVVVVVVVCCCCCCCSCVFTAHAWQRVRRQN